MPLQPTKNPTMLKGGESRTLTPPKPRKSAVPDPPAGADSPPAQPPEPEMPEGWTDPMADLEHMAGVRKTKPRPVKNQNRKTNEDESDNQESSAEGGEDGGEDDGQGGSDQAGEEGSGKGQGGRDPNAAAAAAGEAGEGEDGPSAPEGVEDIPPSSHYLTAKPLREAYDRNKNELTQARKKIADLEQRLKTPGSTQWEEERTSLLERVKASEEAAKLYERQVAMFDYENSREFKEKFKVPLSQAFDAAYAEMAELTVTEPNGSERQATKDDFLKLVALPLKEAATLSTKWFGDVGPHIMNLRNQVKSIKRSMAQAVESQQANSQNYFKEQQAKQAQDQAENTELWGKANQAMVERFPEYFGHKEDDPDHNRLLDKGIREWDLSVNPQSQLTKGQRFQLMAAMRYRAAAFIPLARENNELKKQLTELQDQLDELREGDPGGSGGDSGGGRGGSDKNGPKTWEQDFDETFGKR